MSEQSFYYPRSLIDQNFGLCIAPDDLIFPFYHQSGGNYYRPWKWFDQSGVKDSGSMIQENEEVFKITLDVQHFKPNEIDVKVNDSEVIIEGKHEERQDSHGFISRQFKRRYILSYNCISETVECTLSSDGVLIIIAKKCSKQSKEIVVPIQLCGVPSKSDHIKIKQNTTVVENKNDKVTEINQREKENKKDMQIMLKEEHCRLLKPELLGPAILEANKISSTEAASKISEQLVAKSSMSADVTTGATYEESVEKMSGIELLQQSKKIDNIIAQEVHVIAEHAKQEKDSQKASPVIEETISESSSNIGTGEKLTQSTITSRVEIIPENQILHQGKNTEDKTAQEINMKSENVMTERQISQKASTLREEIISESSSSNAAGEKLSESAVSSESMETSCFQGGMLKKVMTSETATAKTEENKEISEAAERASVQASVSSTTAIEESFEETSAKSTIAKKIEGTEIKEIIENSNTTCGSGMNATIEEIIEKCNAEMAEIASKIAESNMVSSSGKSSMSMSYKSSETQESSFIEESFSSMSSRSKSADEKVSHKVHDVIAELKDAAENI